MSMDDQKNKTLNERGAETLALDDARRVKVLSPNALVIKRFVRNRLAIVGFIAILAMFLFAFVGGWLSPYREDQIFSKYSQQRQSYAVMTENSELRYLVKQEAEFGAAARAQFIGAIGKNETNFRAGEATYSYRKLSDSIYVISGLSKFAEVRKIGADYRVSPVEAGTADAGFKAALAAAMDAGEGRFSYRGVEYTLIETKVVTNVYAPDDIAIASKLVFNLAREGDRAGFELFVLVVEALEAGKERIEFEGRALRIEREGETLSLRDAGDGALYADLSPYVVQSAKGNAFIPLDLQLRIRAAVAEGEHSFVVKNADGGETEYTIERDNFLWNIRSEKDTYVADTYAAPSKEHWLGTDKSGMDVITRLMYGGRVSLIIGFIVVLISLFLGTILGGISGYFGSWVDNLIMRIVDIFYCIPNLPIIIIIGAAMDELRVNPQERMLYLMLILGFLGWPSIARTVRGQILSLREQEFMLATEASGLKVRRRIFTHLIPNVMPQLIVLGSMSVGGTILTESTLSFLGLGVKHPFASWGNIINDVTNAHVMQNYWFVWIPAGICILITVLAFNLIGDGLRDAYDPKMNK